MASAWRRLPACTISGEGLASAPAALIAVSGRGALVATTSAVPAGASVALHHPEAGTVAAAVLGGEPSRLRLDLAGDAAAVDFALAATLADMSGDG